jgi:8-oxo-dGTP pyrophosphatase MutT (NUDIX family)
MKPGKVRPLAICLIQNRGRLLVGEGYDQVKRSTFYRPLGGKIEFGERGAETIAREFMEEIRTRVVKIRLLGVLENIFVFNGEKGHEICLVYAGELDDGRLYDQPEIALIEDNGEEFIAVWIPIEDFRLGKAIIYPDGILDLLPTS